MDVGEGEPPDRLRIRHSWRCLPVPFHSSHHMRFPALVNLVTLLVFLKHGSDHVTFVNANLQRPHCLTHHVHVRPCVASAAPAPCKLRQNVGVRA